MINKQYVQQKTALFDGKGERKGEKEGRRERNGFRENLL